MSEDEYPLSDAFLTVIRFAIMDSQADFADDPDREDYVTINCKLTHKRLEALLRAVGTTRV